MSTRLANPAAHEEAQDVQTTTCVVVGGGPGGVMLSYLLARAGVSVTLLEAHRDFDRDFRGDTLHPSILEIMDQLGLLEKLLELPHAKIDSLTLHTTDGPLHLVDFHRLKTKYPFIAVMPQEAFLDFLANEAKRFPAFRLVLGANVVELVHEDGVVRGVRYRDGDNRLHEVKALLTVGADGRFSRLRHLVGLTPVAISPPMDVLWFRLS